MPKRKLTQEYRDMRDLARLAILVAANKARYVGEGGKKAWTSRHIQQAVFMVRQRKLVPEKVLIAAGFNPTRR